MRQRGDIAIIGAGALGLLYAERLTTIAGRKTCFLAGEERRGRLEQADFLVNGRPLRCPVRTPEELAAPPELIVVAVKNHHLAEIAPLVSAAAGPGTLVISVLNGIDSEAFLEGLGRGRVLPTVALGMDAVREGYALSYSSAGRLLVGTVDGERNDPDLKRLTSLLAEAGIEYAVPEDIIKAVWWKWMINIGVNQVSAVCGAPYGLFHTDPGIRSLMDDAMRETVLVAAAEKVALSERDIEEWYPVLAGLGAEGKTSMLQDMEAGRRTEVDAFSGRLIELAERHGIAVPVNRTLYRIIRAREALFSA